MIDERWQAARRILAVRLDNLGDVLLTTPAIHAMKAALPRAEISLLASPVGAQAGRLNPDLAQVIEYDAPWVDPWQKLPLDSAREQAMIASLRELEFDAAVIFTSYHQSSLPAAFLCYLADIPLRLAASIDGPGSLLTTRHKHPERMMHEVERSLDLVGAVGIPPADLDLVLAVPNDARTNADDHDGHGGPPRRRATQPLIVLHPGCSMPARTYPWEQYAEVVELLVDRLGARVVLTGVAAETELVERIYGRLGPEARAATQMAAGTLAFPAFSALIEAGDLVITNNTGPMHVAAAMKTPVVALFALTNPPEQWHPWRVPHRLLFHDVPCRICYSRVCPYEHDCLRLLTAQDVVSAADELLATCSREEVADGREGAAVARIARRGDKFPRSTDEALPALQTICRNHGPREAASVEHRISNPGEIPTVIRKIAVFRALYLGDLICATPALQALRTCFPEAEVTLIGLPWAQEMVDRLPSLDRLSVFRGYPGLPETLFDAVRTDAFFNEARAEGYDLVVQMHGRGPASNQFVAQLGGRMSLGFAAGAEDRLTTVLPWREEEHEVQRWLRLVAALGAPVDVGRVAFPLGVRDRVQADDLLAHVPFGRGPLIGLHAGAKDPARRWPVGRFAELADRLASGLDARFVLTGTAGERFVTAELATAMRAPALDLTGHTDLGALAAVIERLDLLVTNDTGASHLAAAVGTPSVIVFGPSSPARWAPLNHDLHRAVDARLLADQPLDGAMALASLPVGPVLAACETVLAKGRERVVIGSATSKHPVLEALCDD